jgi:ubiquinone/menaquinone biosynthesis C-methylase UbiE
MNDPGNTYYGEDQIRNVYRDQKVATSYISERFEQPLGRLLHFRQIAGVCSVIEKLPNPQFLEIAPGPARLTVELAPKLSSGGVLLDASQEMLAVARNRLYQVSAEAHWKFVHGDAFQLPFDCRFNIVITFRLIRHFGKDDRLRLYREIKRVLLPNGRLVFDAVNSSMWSWIRKEAPESEFRHYDATFQRDELCQELTDSGFEVESLIGVLHHYPALYRIQVLLGPRSRPLAYAAMRLIDRFGREPMEWIAVCRKP